MGNCHIVGSCPSGGLSWCRFVLVGSCLSGELCCSGELTCGELSWWGVAPVGSCPCG